MRRWLPRILLGLLALSLAVSVGTVLVLRAALPQAAGYRPAAGLGGPVEVLRDAHGVPHIFAETDADAAFALGWVHAEDRLVQMEAMRRLGAGRMAEVVGEPALGLDRWMRTLGLYRLAEAQVPRLSEPMHQVLRAYAAGVNAWLAERPGALPPEYLALGVEPEPWTPADSLVWGRLMGMRLAVDRHDELLRAALAERLAPGKIDALWPPDPAGTPSTLEAKAASDLATVARALLAADPVDARAAGGASNIWIVSGARTTTGKPMLANDPHLSFAIPGTWYLARLVTPERDLAGATTPGVPLVILGQNRHVAWGLTTTNADVEDLFSERLDPADPNRYLTPGGSAPMDVRTEVIRVRGGGEEELTVRATRHGPVVSGLLPRDPSTADRTRVLALAATYLLEDDRTPEAVLGFNRARDGAAFRRALEDFAAPPQNIGWATADGEIGLMVAGRIPVRAGGTGRGPADGTDGRGDWTGWLPTADLPRTVDPPSGWIVNANNRILPTGVPDPLSGRYDPGFRAARIVEALGGTPRHDLATLADIQVDTTSEMARTLLPAMLGALPDAAARAPAVQRLRTWDGVMARDRPEPLIFAAWYEALHPALYADEAGDLAPLLGSDRPLFVARVLKDDADWCDDTNTPARESCAETMAAALDAALGWLSEAFGDDIDAWRWGEAHPALFRHPLARPAPLLGRLLDREIPVGGGLHTPLRAAYRGGDSEPRFAAVHGAGFRAVYDLADPSRSRFTLATGQSGHPLSPHYDDQLGRWRDGGAITLGADRATLRETAAGRLLLAPGGGE